MALDFNGDGLTDFGVTRNEGGLKRWYVAMNGTTTYIAPQWGVDGDEVVPEDFDGDDTADIAVWRQNSGDPERAYFYILQSQTSTVRI